MDMKLIPVKTEYNFEIMGHSGKAHLEHVAGVRNVEFSFDGKLVGSRAVPDGELITDDDCIADILSDYSKNNKTVYADIYSRHKDKVKLVNKIVSVKIDTVAFLVDLTVKCEKNLYTLTMTTNEGKDKIACIMEAHDVSEAFEKSRMLLYGMENLNEEISAHINELASDEIREIFSW